MLDFLIHTKMFIVFCARNPIHIIYIHIFKMTKNARFIKAQTACMFINVCVHNSMRITSTFLQRHRMPDSSGHKQNVYGFLCPQSNSHNPQSQFYEYTKCQIPKASHKMFIVFCVQNPIRIIYIYNFNKTHNAIHVRTHTEFE